MSGICGIVDFSDLSIEELELRRMADAAPHRGIDGTSIWVSHEVGLVFQSLLVTPESLLESQPLIDRHIVLIADARIDNRKELILALDLHTDNPTDADLIIAAYHQWGVDCPSYLVGDYAFAIWDGHAKRLLLVRDPMGMRPLYYRIEAKRLMFASEVKQIISVQRVPIDIYEPALAAYLAGPNMPPEWTFYNGVHQVVAGHALQFEDGHQRRWRYWDIDPSFSIHYKDESEYVEHFRDLFKDAVACRLRSIKPIGLLLSGGIDSCSVASTAGWIMQQSKMGGFPPFLAFCHSFDQFPECDERHISSLVTDHFGFHSFDVPADQAWPLIDYPLHGPDRDEPLVGAYQALAELELSMAREQNVRILLSGTRGDFLTGSWSFDYWGMLLRGRWNALWRELRADSQFQQQAISRIVRRELISPAISRLWPQNRASGLRETIRGTLGRSPLNGKTYAPWVRDDFAQRTRLEETTGLNRIPRSPFHETGRRWRYERIFTDVQVRGLVWVERNQARFGIGFADPWSDRRLASFVLAIPQDIVNRPREYKRLAHYAMKGIMPEPARQSARKITPMPYYVSAIREKARSTIIDLIDNSTAHERGYIDKTVLHAHYDEILAGGRDRADFWFFLTVEMWLRQFWS